MAKSFFLIVLLLISLFSPTIFTQQKVYGQENTEKPISTPTINTTPAIIKYDLAYPGILPDNPLYKLKVLRDKISVGLIADPKNKLEFYLLQADKGILAAAMLVDKKNIKLAKETALKAENNITLLTYNLWRLPKKLDNAFYNKLKTASLKHQEVLVSLEKRVSNEDAKIFREVIEFSKRNWTTIENYQNDIDKNM